MLDTNEILIINIARAQNGAYEGVSWLKDYELPVGWIEVPKELEDVALLYLPWIEITIKNDTLIAVQKNPTPPKILVDDPPPDISEQIKLYISEQVNAFISR